jgi:hypothetical protein
MDGFLRRLRPAVVGSLACTACVAVLVLIPSRAFADQTPQHPDLGTTATPSRVQPGGDVQLFTTACNQGGADGDATAVDGGTFRMEPTLASRLGFKRILSGHFRVAADTPTGNYYIKVRCDNGARSEKLLEVYPTKNRYAG